MLHDLSAVIVGRLLLAGILGGLVGLERQLRHKPAGLRTNILICVGAALFTIISYEMAANVGGDHTRIAAQIIPGIGFIGAGVVLRERGAIMGITSAATIFVMASIGMAVGAGMPVTAIFSTLLCLVALILLGNLEESIGLHARLISFKLFAGGAISLVDRAHHLVEDAGIEPQRWHVHTTVEGTNVEFDAEVSVPQERQLLSQFSSLGVRCEARPLHT